MLKSEIEQQPPTPGEEEIEIVEDAENIDCVVQEQSNENTTNETSEPEYNHPAAEMMHDAVDDGDEGTFEYMWKSTTLMKTTKTRMCDMEELRNRKGRIKPEDDIWWDIRKPNEGKPTRRFSDVGSRLNRSTTAYEQSRRPKVANKEHRSSIMFVNQDCELPPSPLKEEKAREKSTRRISSESPLLKPTMESLQSSWHGSSSRLSIERPSDSFVSPPTMLTRIKGTGPKEVTSKLNDETAALASKRWRSKEEVDKEEKALIAAKKDAALKVEKTSQKLLRPNASMVAKKVGKSKKAENDPREAGWTVFNVVNGTIPDVDLGVPLRRSLGGKKEGSYAAADSSLVEVVVGDSLTVHLRSTEGED